MSQKRTNKTDKYKYKTPKEYIGKLLDLFSECRNGNISTLKKLILYTNNKVEHENFAKQKISAFLGVRDRFTTAYTRALENTALSV